MVDSSDKPSEDAKEAPESGDDTPQSSSREARKSGDRKHNSSDDRKSKEYRERRRTRSMDTDESGDGGIKDDNDGHRRKSGDRKSKEYRERRRTRSMSADDSTDCDITDSNKTGHRRKSKYRDRDSLGESRRSRKSSSRDPDSLKEAAKSPHRKSTSSRDRDSLEVKETPKDASERREARNKEDRDAKNRARAARQSPAGGQPGSSNQLDSSARREARNRQDRDAKNRARRAGSGASRPGASSQLDGSERREARNRQDRDAKNRARRAGSGASRPGVQSVASSNDVARRKGDRSRRNLDGKEAARNERQNRANSGESTVPGVVAETRATRSEKDRSQEDTGEITISPSSVVDTQTSGDEEAVVEAFAIEENETENEVNQNPEEIRRLRQDAEAERRRLKTEQENEALRQQIEQNAQVAAKKKRKRRRRMYAACVLLVLLAGGLGAFFATRSESLTETSELPSDSPVVSLTSKTPTAAPIASTSMEPTENPTELIVYDAPSVEECEKIAAGEPLDGVENFPVQNFRVGMDVEISGIVDIETVTPELQSAIQMILMPDLAGCPVEVAQRKLRRSDGNTRQLQSIRNVVASATFDLVVDQEASCSVDRSPPCHVLALELVARLLGEEKVFAVSLIIGEVFGNGIDIRPKLQLDSPFRSIQTTSLRSKDPTGAPSTLPTFRPSIRPSFAPVVGPTTAAPTKTPTESPTPPPTRTATTSPTTAATNAPFPGATPVPTIAPFPGATPVPTKSPTFMPTSSPTELPTKNPTRIPTTGIPTENPTDSPSKLPTEVPSDRPSLSPTLVASASPSVTPPSREPTDSPTFRTYSQPPESYLITPLAAASQSSTFANASLAIDGNTCGDFGGTCNSVAHTWWSNVVNQEETVWWEVDLGFSAAVTRVVVWGRTECCSLWLYNSKLQLLDDTGTMVESSVITLGENNSNNPASQDFIFSGNTNVQTIRVEWDGIDVKEINLAEVQVYGYVNLISDLAVASQTSTFADANFAIDGNTCGNFFACGPTISHTWNSEFPSDDLWWEVNLGLTAEVQRVVVWNRIEQGPTAIWMYGSTLQLIDTSGTVKANAFISLGEDGILTPSQEFWFEGITNIRTIRIKWGGSLNDAGNGELCIAEVEAFGTV
ncbi:MAG: hypothetical protein SGBAC_010334 [Bacillariaceae sp.]